MNPVGVPLTHTPRRTRKALAVATTIVVVATALGGCGSSSSSPTTSSASAAAGPSPSPTASSNKLQEFARCMRAHGTPNFPDPTPQGTFQLPASLTASPQFKAADDACKSLAPPGPLRGQAPTTSQLNQALKFVHCMRKQGVNLPDPTPQGSFKNKLTASGMDPNSPQFKRALYSCRSLLPPGNGFGTGH
jgi:hypothetical protein